MTMMAPGPGSAVKPNRGVLILVFGILGLLVCFPFGIAAWVMGNQDMREMNAGTMDPTGLGLTSAGRIIGMIATILWAIGVVIWILIVGAVIVIPHPIPVPAPPR